MKTKTDTDSTRHPRGNTVSHCPAIDALSQLLASSLQATNDRDARVQQHVETCSDCQAALESLTSDEVCVSRQQELPAYLSSMLNRSPVTLADEIPLPTIPGYEVRERIGVGGMGAIYRASHQRLERDVAIKVIAAGQHVRAEVRNRLDREGRLLARLKHRNVVQIYDSGEHDGLPYLVLEVVEDGNLNDRKQDIRDPDDVSRLIGILAKAVGAAHEVGIIHRDLKPANILLEADVNASPDHSIVIGAQRFVPKITDFGLSKQLLTCGDELDSGSMMGTPSYMSPEQACEDAEAVGRRTDTFALGVIMYELLTGQRPFQGNGTLATLELIRSADVPAPSTLRSEVPDDLDDVCLRCLQKDPAQRPDMADIANALQHRQKLVGASGVANRTGRGGWLVAASLLVAILFGLVIKVQTDVGEVQIECHDPEIEVAIKRNGEPFETFKVLDDQESRRVGIGDIMITLNGAKAAEYAISDSEFILSRGDRKLVTISRKGSNDATRKVVEQFLEAGGRVLLHGGNAPRDYIGRIENLPDGKLDVHTLRPGGKPFLANSDMLQIGEIESLQELYLSYQRLSPASLRHIGSLPNLKLLDIFQTPISDDGLKAAVGECPQLQSLVVAGSKVTPAGLQHIAHLKQLQMLSFSQKQLEIPGALQIVKSLPKLRTIRLISVKDSGLQNLLPITSIQTLSVQWCRDFTSLGLGAIADCSGLQTITFFRCNLAECDVTVLTRLKHLKKLRFTSVAISDAAIDSLKTALPNTNIAIVDPRK